jgi:hypothetical protein
VSCISGKATEVRGLLSFGQCDALTFKPRNYRRDERLASHLNSGEVYETLITVHLYWIVGGHRR